MLSFTEKIYVDKIPHGIETILVGDIGGTNSNFGIFAHTNKGLQLLFSIHIKSQKITKFIDAVQQVIKYVKEKYNISVKKCCFAAAGVPSEDRMRCKPTNLGFAIDAQEILDKTGLTCAFIANDFEVIGYGFDGIDQKDLVLVNKGKPRREGTKAILGAGTGLGKCIMVYNKELGRYQPVASEGGHADFAAQDQLDIDLIEFIKDKEKLTCPVSWEDVLSGEGIKRMYQFFVQKNQTVKANKKISHDGPHPDEIFNSRHLDEHAFKTFELYSIYYARCAKNFALDVLALGGVYIAGGIAAKNLPLFEQKCFLNEFTSCGKQQELLKNIPIYVITDYNVSLFGAASYMIIEGMCD